MDVTIPTNFGFMFKLLTMTQREELVQDIWNNLIAIPHNKSKNREFQLSPSRLRQIVYKYLKE